MDRKSLIVLASSFALLFLWFWIVPKIYPPIPKPISTNLVTTATSPAAATNAATNAITLPPPTASAVPTNLAAPLVAPGSPEQVEKLETGDAVYTFTSHGGGLKLVELKKYPITSSRGPSTKAGSNEVATLNHRALVPVLAVRGNDVVAGDNLYKLTKTSATSLRAEKLLPNGLAVVKDFRFTSNFLLAASVRLENRADQAVTVPEYAVAAGTSSLMEPEEAERFLSVYWFGGVKAEKVDPGWFDNTSFMGCLGGTSVPRPLFTANASNLLWSAVPNQFFTLAVMGSTNNAASQLKVLRVELPPDPRSRVRQPHNYGYEASLIYPGAVLAPGQAVERRYTLYAGPKEYRSLARIAPELDAVMDFGMFHWFAKALLLSMNVLYQLVPNYGLVIILITVIIKLLFWPLTQASTRSMKRMQQLQPQMKALQEKYKDDPMKQQKKLMEFMKENKVSPLGGCLPMMLQIPVFIGFYTMIQSAIELRGVRFLWAYDLSKPDTVAYLPGLDFPVNLLPLVMGATMLWQARMTPPSPGMDPTQQKIMKYMPMMFMVFLYNFSAGLTLYWTVQNLLTIAQMKLTKAQDPATAAKPAAPVAPLKKKK
ncbi:MAG: membrane protein insertase YidC [Verrucomicrobia bacterium]|nr:membrane protein insertase YidC [Verrucomicrobiota bacterium]